MYCLNFGAFQRDYNLWREMLFSQPPLLDHLYQERDFRGILDRLKHDPSLVNQNHHEIAAMGLSTLLQHVTRILCEKNNQAPQECAKLLKWIVEQRPEMVAIGFGLDDDHKKYDDAPLSLLALRLYQFYGLSQENLPGYHADVISDCFRHILQTCPHDETLLTDGEKLVQNLSLCEETHGLLELYLQAVPKEQLKEILYKDEDHFLFFIKTEVPMAALEIILNHLGKPSQELLNAGLIAACNWGNEAKMNFLFGQGAEEANVDENQLTRQKLLELGKKFKEIQNRVRENILDDETKRLIQEYTLRTDYFSGAIKNSIATNNPERAKFLLINCGKVLKYTRREIKKLFFDVAWRGSCCLQENQNPSETQAHLWIAIARTLIQRREADEKWLTEEAPGFDSIIYDVQPETFVLIAPHLQQIPMAARAA